MLQEKVVEARTLALIRKLSDDLTLKNFALVGGTALALQLGHRKSIDIDLFTAREFDPRAVANHLDTAYQASGTAVTGRAIFTHIDGIKTDLIAHAYPWIRPIQFYEGIRMASLDDIAAMKLHAIVNSGTRLKDFVDIHFLLGLQNLDQLTASYLAKYPDSNASIAKNALLYHHEIKSKKDLELMDGEFRWPDIAKRLKAAVAEPKRVFQTKQSASIDLPKHEDRNISQHQGKGRKR